MAYIVPAFVPMNTVPFANVGLAEMRPSVSTSHCTFRLPPMTALFEACARNCVQWFAANALPPSAKLRARETPKIRPAFTANAFGMIDHLSLGVRDVKRSTAFYDAVLEPL